MNLQATIRINLLPYIVYPLTLNVNEVLPEK